MSYSYSWALPFQSVRLPNTEQEFDSLVDTIVRRYHLSNREHAAAVVANRIQHLPPEQSHATIGFLGRCVIKNIAYQIAQAKSSQIHHKQQVDMLVSQLTSDPNDQQARDALDRAVKEGSEYAKAQADRLPPPSGNQNVVQLNHLTNLTAEQHASVPPGTA